MAGNRDEGDSGNRRQFLRGVAAATFGGRIATAIAGRDLIQPVDAGACRGNATPGEVAADADGTFPQSVASGGPTDSGAILWTRIAPEAYVSGRPLGVQVATDCDFRAPVVDATVPATAVGPEHDYCVKVDLDGRLDSNAFYRYRFVYGDAASRPGRFRTLPASDDDISELSVAVLTCQDYQNGYYGAYSHVAEEDVDYLVHLGDFVYESANGEYLAPSAEIRDGRDFELPSGNDLAETLADFRHLYNTYKSDPLLQRALERHTLIAGWSDHEIGNDRFWDYDADAPVVPGKPDGHDPAFAAELTANGIQAWVEHVPARVRYDPTAANLHEQFQLWRTVSAGDLVEFVVTDERLFRDGPPCEPGARADCAGAASPERTMLGERQKRWWKRTMAESTATWTAWANEVLTTPLSLGVGADGTTVIEDSWDGYQAERHELMSHLAESGPRNVVTLTGDLHCSLAGYMRAGYGLVEPPGERVGVELMAPAVTSVTAADVLDLPPSVGESALSTLVIANNPHLEYVDWFRNGYAVVTFGRDACRYTVYAVDSEIDSADAERTKLASYTVPEGKVDLREP